VQSESTTPRRQFLGRMASAAAAAGISASRARSQAAEALAPDYWIKEVKGTHKRLFDFPQHKNAMPLLHILNYINSYAAPYKTGAGAVGTVGTPYSAVTGPASPWPSTTLSGPSTHSAPAPA
jgi:hypothetical protein